MQAKTAAPAPPTEAVAMLAAAVAKSGDVAAVQKAIDIVTDASQPEWRRPALLQGLDAGLPAPGAARRRRRPPRRRGRWRRSTRAERAGRSGRGHTGPGSVAAGGTGRS